MRTERHTQNMNHLGLLLYSKKYIRLCSKKKKKKRNLSKGYSLANVFAML